MAFGFSKRKTNQFALEMAMLFTGRGYTFEHGQNVFAKGDIRIFPAGQEHRGKTVFLLILSNESREPLSAPVFAGCLDEIDQAIDMLENHHAAITQTPPCTAQIADLAHP